MEETNLNTQQTPEEAAQEAAQQAEAPAPKEQNAVQKLLAKLLHGEQAGDAAEPKAEEAKDEKPKAKEGQPAAKEPQGKTYTEADLQQALDRQKAKMEEQARLAKLQPDERAKEEAARQAQELADTKAQLLRMELHGAAVKQLTAEGYPAQLADVLQYASKEEMETSLQAVTAAFKGALEGAIKERLRGKTPEGLGGAALRENAIAEEIRKGIKGGI